MAHREFVYTYNLPLQLQIYAYLRELLGLFMGIGFTIRSEPFKVSPNPNIFKQGQIFLLEVKITIVSDNKKS